jgi:Intracellular proteinase inhibitor
MKKLFILALLPVSAVALGAPPKPAPAPKPAAAESAPPPERPRKPGFWERAWGSTIKGTRRVGSVLNPFDGGGDKPAESKLGWRNLAMSLTLDPAAVKLPDTRAVRVTLTVINKGKMAVQLEFPTTQRIEVLIKSENGNVISKWSDDQKVEKEEGFLVINPSERLEYSATISTREMAVGKSYIIEAYFPDFDQLRASRTVSPSS